jgi:hypothetical protein
VKKAVRVVIKHIRAVLIIILLAAASTEVTVAMLFDGNSVEKDRAYIVFVTVAVILLASLFFFARADKPKEGSR